MISPSTSEQAGDEREGGSVEEVPDTELRLSASEAAVVIRAIRSRLRFLDNDIVKAEGAAELAAEPDASDVDTTGHAAALARLRQERQTLCALLDRLS